MTDVAAGSEQKVAGAAAGGGAGQATSGSAAQDTAAGAATEVMKGVSTQREAKALADTNTEELMSQMSGIAAKVAELGSQVATITGQRGERESASFDAMAKLGTVDIGKGFMWLGFQAMNNGVWLAHQHTQNAISHAKDVDAQILTQFNLAVDRMWNIDEVSDLSAKSGVQADTIQAIASAVVAKLLAAQKPA